MDKSCLDVKSEPRGAYRIAVDDADGNWIKTFGDLDPEVYKGYMGADVAKRTEDVAAMVDRMPEGSAIHVAAGRTEVFNRDKSVAVLPVGLDEFDTTISVLHNIVKEPESAGIL